MTVLYIKHTHKNPETFYQDTKISQAGQKYIKHTKVICIPIRKQRVKNI